MKRFFRLLLLVPAVAVSCSASPRDEAATAVSETGGTTGPNPASTGSTADGSAGSGPQTATGPATAGGTGSGTAGPLFDVGAGTGGGGDGGGLCPCEQVQDGIYVLDALYPPHLWFFEPQSAAFSDLGALTCVPQIGWVANSMGVDRLGHAWINYYHKATQQARIFKVPLSDPSTCEERPYVPPNVDTWWLWGMGFAVTDAQSNCDELFVYNNDKYIGYPAIGGGSFLARYRMDADTLDVVGPTEFPVAELSGTGDGRLFAFAAKSGSETLLAQLDKATGATLSTMPLTVDLNLGFAFAFWGGDVYLFTQRPDGDTSRVTRLDLDGNDGGGEAVVVEDAGILVSGAGVSTCASYLPPG